MTPGKPSKLVKPTLDTLFHIDYSWWERSDEKLRPYLLSQLPPEVQERYFEKPETRIVDYIDPNTAEVFKYDEIQMEIQKAAEATDFISDQISVVDSVFRVFLTNGNVPLTPRELAEKTKREPRAILKTFGSTTRVYKGIRPYQAS